MTRSISASRQAIQDMKSSLSFNGTTSKVVIAQTLGLPLYSASGYSVVGWFYGLSDSSGNTRVLYGEGNTANNAQNFVISNSNDKVKVTLVNNSSVNQLNSVFSTTVLRTNAWNSFAWVDSGGVCALYVNGVLDATNYNYTPAPPYTFNTSSLGFLNRLAPAAFYPGLLSNIQLFNRALTPVEVANVLNGSLKGNIASYSLAEGAGTIAYDTSGNGNNGTITAGTYALDTPVKKRQLVNQNLVYNGDFEYGPNASADIATNIDGVWIDGTAAGTVATNGYKCPFGWGTAKFAGSGTAQFDTTVSHSGANSLKVSTTATASRMSAGSIGVSNTVGIKTSAIPALPNTSYTVSGYMKTNYISGDATTGAQLKVVAADGTGTFTNTPYSSSGVKATQDWTLYTNTFTTNATTRYLYVSLDITGNNGAATLIMDAWIDDIVLMPTTATTRSIATGRSAA